MENFFVKVDSEISLERKNSSKSTTPLRHPRGMLDNVLNTQNHPYLYDNGAAIVSDSDGIFLCRGVDDHTHNHDTECISLPFYPSFFVNMTYDFGLVSEKFFNESLGKHCCEVFRINKYKKSIVSVGHIVDDILCAFPLTAGFLVITHKELLLFDDHCEPKGSAEHGLPDQIIGAATGNNRMGEPSDQEWYLGIEQAPDMILLVSHADNTYCAKLFSADLEEMNDFSSWKIRSAVYNGRYNKFCALISHEVRFIEPNGLEHGKKLVIEACCDPQRLYSVKSGSETLLVVAGKECALLYYMKNFFWYLKALVPYRIIGTAGRHLIALGGSDHNGEPERRIEAGVSALSLDGSYTLILLSICREFSDGFVVSGRDVFYTSFERGLVPPPYFHQKIETGEWIRRIYTHSADCTRHLLVDHGKEVRSFSVRGLKVEKTTCSMSLADISETIECTLAEFSDYITRIALKSTRRQIGGCVADISIPNLKEIPGNVQNITVFDDLLLLQQDGHEFYIVHSLLSGTRTVVRCCLSLQEEGYGSISVDRVYSIGNEPLIVMTNGTLFYKKHPVMCLRASNISRVQDGPFPDTLSIQDGDKLVVIETKENGESSIVAEFSNIVSFIVSGYYIIYTSKNRMVILRNYKEIESFYVDDNQQVLAVVNESIVSQTRFGTLETIESQTFSLDTARLLVEAKEYRKTACFCDRKNASYDVFFCDGIAPLDVLDHLTGDQVLKLLQELLSSSPITAKNVLLFECEVLKAARRAFHRQFTETGVFLVKGDSLRLEDNLLANLSVLLLIDEIEKLNPFDEKNSLKYATSAEENTGVSSRGLSERDVLAVIDKKNPIPSLSSIFRSKLSSASLNTLLGILIMIKRTDLIFFSHDLRKSIRYALARLSKDQILRAAVQSLDMEKIRVAYDECKADVSKIVCLCSYEVMNGDGNDPHNTELSDYQKFLLLDHIGDCNEALLYLSRHEKCLSERVKEYVVQHDLFGELVFYHFAGLLSFDDAYLFVAGYCPAATAFYLEYSSGDTERALETAKKNLLWKQALEMFGKSDDDAKRRVAVEFVEILKEGGMYEEAGIVYEKHLHAYREAFSCYMEADRFDLAQRTMLEYGLEKESEVSKQLHDKMDIRVSELIILLRECTSILKAYTARLHSVRGRIEDGIEQSTTTSCSQSSSRTIKRALTRDRPGSMYEHEFVLNKIREFCIELKHILDKADNIIKVADKNNFDDIIDAVQKHFAGVREMSEKEIAAIWSYERPGADPNRPLIERPDIGAE